MTHFNTYWNWKFKQSEEMQRIAPLESTRILMGIKEPITCYAQMHVMVSQKVFLGVWCLKSHFEKEHLGI